MDLKLPISHVADLAAGEIELAFGAHLVFAEFVDEFTVGILHSGGREVEFRVEAEHSR